MTREEIKKEIAQLIKFERQNDKRFLIVLKEAEDSRAYLMDECTSLYLWLIKEFKYSEPAAQRRIEAVRLMRSVPEIQQKLEDGALNLSTLGKASLIIKAHEKATNTKLSNQEKAEAIQRIENHTVKEAEQALLDKFPEAAPDLKKPRQRQLKNKMTQFALQFTEEDMETLKRVKQLLSHKFPKGENSDVFRHLANLYLKDYDPCKHVTSEAEEMRVKNGNPSQAHIRRSVFQSTGGRCCHVDSKGNQCESFHQVQSDHIHAKGKGGDNTRANQRPLCRKHNLLEAEKTFGEKHMAQFRKDHIQASLF